MIVECGITYNPLPVRLGGTLFSLGHNCRGTCRHNNVECGVAKYGGVLRQALRVWAQTRYTDEAHQSLQCNRRELPNIFGSDAH